MKKVQQLAKIVTLSKNRSLTLTILIGWILKTFCQFSGSFEGIATVVGSVEKNRSFRALPMLRL